jgi:hypothetical protein
MLLRRGVSSQQQQQQQQLKCTTQHGVLPSGRRALVAHVRAAHPTTAPTLRRRQQRCDTAAAAPAALGAMHSPVAAPSPAAGRRVASSRQQAVGANGASATAADQLTAVRCGSVVWGCARAAALHFAAPAPPPPVSHAHEGQPDYTHCAAATQKKACPCITPHHLHSLYTHTRKHTHTLQ